MLGFVPVMMFSLCIDSRCLGIIVILGLSLVVIVVNIKESTYLPKLYGAVVVLGVFAVLQFILTGARYDKLVDVTDSIEFNNSVSVFVSTIVMMGCICTATLMSAFPIVIITEATLLGTVILLAIIAALGYRELREEDIDDRYDCGFVYDDETRTIGESRLIISAGLAVDLLVTVNFFCANTTEGIIAALIGIIIWLER